ncbi:MAG: hypothetical protein Q8Q31_00085 [Nanoarchaeota archaeon]|nr:hypothetical protein [Nanoarchaeota archaeon]
MNNKQVLIGVLIAVIILSATSIITSLYSSPSFFEESPDYSSSNNPNGALIINIEDSLSTENDVERLS